MKTTASMARIGYFRRKLGDICSPFGLFMSYWPALSASAFQSMNTRFAGSVLGIWWLILGPLFFMSIYAVLYAFVFKVQPADMSTKDYILNILSGLIPYMAFSQAITLGSASLSVDKSLLLNRVFPAELIPVREVLSSTVFLVVGFIIILFSKALYLEFYFSYFFIPLFIAFYFFTTVGITWFFSIAGLIIKDTQQVIGYFLMILLLASPIAFTPTMVPGWLKPLMYVNPLSPLIQAFQSILVFGKLPSIAITTGCFIVSFISFVGFFKVFSFSKKIVADSI
jgi:lipopolysaccharide transport system permease protein